MQDSYIKFIRQNDEFRANPNPSNFARLMVPRSWTPSNDKGVLTLIPKVFKAIGDYHFDVHDMSCHDLGVVSVEGFHFRWSIGFIDDKTLPESERVLTVYVPSVEDMTGRGPKNLPPAASVEVLDFKTYRSRIVSALHNCRVVALGDLKNVTPHELLRTPNFGHQSMRELQRAIDEAGYALAA